MCIRDSQTLVVEDGNNIEEIGKAIEEAKADKTRPTMIKMCIRDRLWNIKESCMQCRLISALIQ